MKQKKKISFLLGMVLIASILVGLGRIPVVSMAMTTATVTASETNTQIITRLLALIAQLQTQLKQLIAAKNTTTIQCSWCGNSCINWAGRSNTICANVMPPANSYCQNINGTCQITSSITKYSCSTAAGTIPGNNYTGCIPSSNGTFNSLAECQNYCPVSTIPTISSIVPNQVSANTRVTIYGSNLSSATNVKFFYPTGQESASLELPSAGSIVTSNSIEFTISSLFAYNSDAGTYQVKVVTPFGTSNGLNLTLVNQPIPAPITLISPNGGESMILGNTYTIRWNGSMQQMRLLYAKQDGSIDFARENIPIVSHYGVSDSSGSYLWTIPKDIPINHYYVQIEGCCGETGGSDNSDNYFNISSPVLPTQCTDPDGGNPYMKTTVTANNQSYTDVCTDSNNVKEYYCDANKTAQSYPVNCGSGWSCIDGACKQVTVSTTKPASTITCTDTDGGDAMYQKGTIAIRTAADGAWNYTDYCQSSTLLQEYSCLSNFSNYLDSNAMSAYMVSGHICETGSTCYDGACKIMGSYLRPPCGNYGDVDLDGYITSSDTEIIANYPAFSSRLTAEQKARANVNLDGVVDYLDASILSQYISKSISTFPLCPNVKGVETHIFDTDLSYGMENEDVKELQSILAQKGYFTGIVSGYFGWQTEGAVKAFQLANNLPTTGFAGSLTRGLLNN
jgi:hypothetical protein